MYSKYRSGASYRGMRPKRNNGMWVALIILLIAAIVFFAASGSLGKWISERIILPLMDASPTPVPSSADPLPDASPTPSASQGAQTSTSELKLPGVTAYAVQMGLFDDEAGAKTYAEQIKKQGAAGYLYQDQATGYRVLAAAFAQESDAETVRTQLKEGGVEAVLYTLSVPALDIEFTASQEQLQGLEQGFNGWIQFMQAVEAVYLLPQSELDTAKTKLAEGLTAAQKSRDALAALQVENNAIYSGMLGLYDQFLPQLETEKNRSEALSFFAGIRYNYLDMFTAYERYLGEITSNR